MYQQFLWIHSWLRWVVLLAGVLILLRNLIAWALKRPWSALDHSLVLVYTQLLTLQVGIGTLLYLGISPIPKMAFIQKEWMKDALLRFWALEHPLLMVIAYLVFLLGRHLAYCRKPPTQRHPAMAITLASTYILVLIAIPWPALIHGRPFFR